MTKKIQRGEAMSDAEFKSMKTKTELVMSMSGANPETALTVLSHALIITTLNAEVLFSSVIRNLAEMYETAIEQHNDDEDDDE